MILKELLSLSEGGNVFKDEENVTTIKKKDIPDTIKYISRISGISENDLYPLGSVGKAAVSGDIDLAIDINNHDPESVHAHMCEKLGKSHCSYNKGTRIGSYLIPIAGDINNSFVQVDFMFVPNVEWASFAFFSAGDSSKYKGVIRTILLSAVAASLNKPGTDYFEYAPDGSLIIRAGRGIDLSKGLKRLFKFRAKSKLGDKYLSQMKSVSIDDFKEMFPQADIHGDNLIIDNPNSVVNILFGPGINPSDVETAEQVLKLINVIFPKDKREEIFKYAKARLKSHQKLMNLPKELKDES